MSGSTDRHPRSDGDLLRAAAEGNESAFWEFCVRSLPTFRRILHLRCSQFGFSRDLAEDAAQEAMVRAVRWLRENKGGKISLNWLVKIGTNLMFDWARGNSREVSAEHKLDQVADKGEQLEDKLDVLAGFERLASEDREILELVLIEHHTLQEAGQIIGIKRWAAYKRYERALKRLRALLAER